MIHHPARELKTLQRWLLRRVISDFPVHSAAVAYRNGVTIWDNALAHVRNHFLLRMDLTDFFPSITFEDVELYLDRMGGWDAVEKNFFCELVCREYVLTIGAPTSPTLSNALCYELDKRLTNLAQERDTIYTRYADDFFFSTNEPGVLREMESEVKRCCKELDCPSDLSVNTKKTRHSSKKRARRVTGIVLGSDLKPHVGRKLKRRIRAMVHQYDQLGPEEKASLAGLISYVIGFDREFLNALIMKYGTERVIAARAWSSVDQ